MAAPMKSVFGLARNLLLPKLTRQINGCLCLKNYSAVTSTAESKRIAEPFDLYSGLIIERRAVVTAELTDLEKRYQQLMSTIELERSHYSKHELRHQADIELASNKEGGGDKEQSTLTAVDMEDIWSEERSMFTSAPRETEADGTGNTKTSHRHLDQCLYLLVKQSFSPNTSHWVFPQALSPDGESTRQTTNNILGALSTSLTVKHLGNAPSAFYKLMYPKTSVTDEDLTVGAKVFLHKALVLNGDLTAIADDLVYKDFCWATVGEVEHLVSKTYWRAVKPVLHKY